MGMDEIKKSLQTNVIYPLQFRELSEEFGLKTNGGILFYGPPGNGKTYLAESLAGEAGISFLELNPAFLYNEYFGKYEKNISEIFKLARETAPNILFFDEVETLIPKRENTDHSVVKRGVTQLLIEINKLMSEEQSKTYLVAATNLPWDIDPAMLRPGRFDLKIYVPLPNRGDREALLERLLKSTAFSKDISAREIADLTDGFSVSDVDFIIRQSAEKVFYEAVGSGIKRKITKEDILDSISRIKPSSNKTIIQKYNQFIR
jgi:transitional endoplasmic reticulum ATPase